MVSADTKELHSFIAKCQKLIEDRVGDRMTDEYHLSADFRGRKNIRIVRGTGSIKQVFCFIDASNGDVLKADGWKRPAKHARGNIFDEHNGMKNMAWTGPAYLK